MKKKKVSPFNALFEKSKTIQTYHSLLHLLHWDQETFMPPGAAEVRAEQIAELASLVHKEKTSPSYKQHLEKLVSLSSGKIKGKHRMTDRAIIREWHRDFVREHKLPLSFVKNFAELTSTSSQIWVTAKKEKNFKLFAPFLDRIIKMNRQKAEILGFAEHPYDALLELHEPCMTVSHVSHIFQRLKKELIHLMQKMAKLKAPDSRFLYKTVEHETQRQLGQWMSSLMPYDPQYTRLDVSSHPFSIAMHPHDSRITTRYLPNNFMSNLFSVLHEAGHAMYEMGLPLKYYGTPLCQATSSSVHESQSRWWENLIGRSLPFWKCFYPALQKQLPAILGKVDLPHFYQALHHVTPSFIRVESDEVTYSLHIILRFELEQELLSGELSVHDLPEAWDAKFQQFFGIKPPDVAQGCLQDIHWSMGEFGYFPTYALGNILASHLFRAFAKQHPDWEKRVEHGELLFIRTWLQENIHQWGRMYNFNELGKKATGKAVDETAYCQYLNKKYTELYDM